jgi:hypothetical protein
MTPFWFILILHGQILTIGGSQTSSHQQRPDTPHFLWHVSEEWVYVNPFVDGVDAAKVHTMWKNPACVSP